MQRRSWTSAEDVVLVKRVKLYGVKNWTKVADGLPSRTGKSCSERWRHFLDPAVKSPSQQAFTDYEASVIVRAHEVYGNKWQAIAAMLPGRSCRAVKNYFHTHMGANAVTRGSIMVSNPYLAAGHSLEALLAAAPAVDASWDGTPASNWDTSDVDTAEVFEQKASPVMACSQQLAFNNALAAPQFALLPTSQPALQPQFMQMLTAQPQLPIFDTNVQCQQTVAQQQQACFAPATAAATTAATGWPAQLEEQCSASGDPSPRTSNALFGDATLCDQLLMGFSTAPMLQRSSSCCSADSTAQCTRQASAMPSWHAASPLDALAGMAALPELGMERLVDELSASDFDAILADFDSDLPLDLQWQAPWGDSSAPQQQQRRQQQQQQHVPQCPCCQAEAGLMAHNSCTASPCASAPFQGMSAPSPSSSYGASPGSPVSCSDAGAVAGVGAQLVPMGSVASMFSAEGGMDVSQVTAVLAEQQRRLAAQQLELQQQQQQLDALRAQLAQAPSRH